MADELMKGPRYEETHKTKIRNLVTFPTIHLQTASGTTVESQTVDVSSILSTIHTKKYVYLGMEHGYISCNTVVWD